MGRPEPPLLPAPRPAESLPPSDADLIAASRSADNQAAYAILYERHAAAARSLRRSIHAEMTLAALILLTTAALTTLMGPPALG